MSEAKKQHDDLVKRITDFYNRENQWGLITNNEQELKKLKSIASKVRILRNWKKRNRLREVKSNSSQNLILFVNSGINQK